MKEIVQSFCTPNYVHHSKDLLHVDFTGIELTMEMNRLSKVVNVLLFQDHFTKHVMAYVNHNQTMKTVAKFL